MLVTRDSKGKINAFLNVCRHRGNRVCRADSGNASAFVCAYHGWTYGTDGKLIAVPSLKEAYYDELDTSKWGLVPVAQLDSYKGLVFATFDPSAPSLNEYLGDMKWYLDALFDRREGGIEVFPGMQKWIIPVQLEDARGELRWRFVPCAVDPSSGHTHRFQHWRRHDAEESGRQAGLARQRPQHLGD